MASRFLHKQRTHVSAYATMMALGFFRSAFKPHSFRRPSNRRMGHRATSQFIHDSPATNSFTQVSLISCFRPGSAVSEEQCIIDVDAHERFHAQPLRNSMIPGTCRVNSSFVSTPQWTEPLHSVDAHLAASVRRYCSTTRTSSTDENGSLDVSGWFSLQGNRSFSTNEEATVVEVSIEEARATTAQALRNIGWEGDDATLQAEIMVAAELCGNNQGLVKMYQPEMMAPAPNSGKPTVQRETPNSAVINGNQAPGMLVAVRAADLAVEKAKSGAIAIVTSYNTSTSSGQLAFYVERMARQGMVGIAMANSPEFVAAAQGGKRVFGTNPLAVGVPVAGSAYPFTFDMATSAIALFGLLTAKAKGEDLPPNVAYGRNGNWSTNAAEVLEDGAIATFGGHKGAGLSLCVELLAGALSGSAVLGQVTSKKDAKSWGHTMIAIQPDSLVDDFPSKAASILNAVKASGGNIRIPGERSAKTAQERLKTEKIPIPRKIWDSIVSTATSAPNK